MQFKNILEISHLATVSGINVHVEDEREKLPEPGEGFIIVTDVNALNLDGILQNITDKSCQLWVKNRKVWTGVKSFEITKKYKAAPYHAMEVLLTLDTDPEYTKRIHKNDLKIDFFWC